MNKRQLLTILSVAAAATLAGCASAPAPAKLAKLTIGVQATKPEETRAAWLPLVQDIGKKHSIATELVTASQTDTVSLLRDGKVDMVWLSSSVAIDAVVDAGAQAFALYYNVNGTNGYKGVVITRADSGITTLDQALTPGKYSYATGAKTSTSGYVLPQHFLFNARNTTPEKLFKSVVTGGHFPNLDTLWESPLVPNDVLMVRKDAPESVKSAVKDIFLSYGKSSAAEKELLKKASGIDYFVPTTNQLLEPVSEFKFATERAGVQGNATLGADDKARQLARIDARAATFKSALN